MKPDLVTLALIALQNGKFADAREHIQIYADGNKREPQHYLIEGLASLALADWHAAGQVFQNATDEFPDNPQFWFNRGLAEENLGKLPDAETSFQRSLSLKPEQGEVFGNLSNIYRKLGRFPEAVQMACRALATGIPKAHALNVLGLALAKQGNFTEATRAFDEAIAMAPSEASIIANRANLAVDQLQFDDAWKFFAEARSLDDLAVIRRDEGMARLLAGDFATGLPLYEARLELPHALRVRPDAARWNGEDLSGKTLLLISEQGFGDTIQFSRYGEKLVAMGANLTWCVRQPLQRLLTINLPGQVVLESETLPACDFWLPILSLPHALGMTSATEPKAAVWRASAEPRLPAANGKRKIGLVWKGSRTHERDHERSVALSLLAPLWQKIDAQFFAPFKEAAEDLKSGDTPVIDCGNLIHDFADSAALLSQLDCLVTVDTAAAHLAGALGVKTYVLLPHCPDWRWGTAGEETAWYPNMTLIRQPRYADWPTVIEQLLEKLA